MKLKFESDDHTPLLHPKIFATLVLCNLFQLHVLACGIMTNSARNRKDIVLLICMILEIIDDSLVELKNVLHLYTFLFIQINMKTITSTFHT